MNGTQPSLRDFVAWASAFPALKRWAIVNRPSGTSLVGIPKGALLVGNSKLLSSGECMYATIVSAVRITDPDSKTHCSRAVAPGIALTPEA